MKQATLIYDLEYNLLHFAMRDDDTCVWNIKQTRALTTTPHDKLNIQLNIIERMNYMQEVVSFCLSNNIEFKGVIDKEKVDRM